MSELAITAEDVEQAKAYENLGAEYFAARRTAERFIAHFEPEAFKPLIDKFTEEFRDRLWSDVSDWLLNDTENNLQSEIWRIVEGTVEALLTGEEWAMRRYPYADYSRGEQVRRAVAQHGGEELLNRRIADLEKEVADLRERNRRLSDRGYY